MDGMMVTLDCQLDWIMKHLRLCDFGYVDAIIGICNGRLKRKSCPECRQHGSDRHRTWIKEEEIHMNACMVLPEKGMSSLV